MADTPKSGRISWPETRPARPAMEAARLRLFMVRFLPRRFEMVDTLGNEKGSKIGSDNAEPKV